MKKYPDRSRQRKKDVVQERVSKLEEQIREIISGSQLISQPQANPQKEAAFNATGQGSQQKSSVASTWVWDDDLALMDDALMARYPVDDITERENCELHQSMKNISMKVAVGFALPSEPGACFHGGQILAGYARVRVDEGLKGYETLELDIPAGEGEMTLGEFTHGIILWKKESIVFLDSAPRPPTPPSSNPPLSPPLLERDHSASPFSISGTSADSAH